MGPRSPGSAVYSLRAADFAVAGAAAADAVIAFGVRPVLALNRARFGGVEGGVEHRDRAILRVAPSGRLPAPQPQSSMAARRGRRTDRHHGDGHAGTQADRVGAALSRGADGDAGRLGHPRRDRAPDALARHARRHGTRDRRRWGAGQRRRHGPGRQDLRHQQRRLQLDGAAGQAFPDHAGRRLQGRQHPDRGSRDGQVRDALRCLRRPAPARTQ